MTTAPSIPPATPLDGTSQRPSSGHTSGPGFADLRARLQGELLLPTDEGWDRVRAAWHLLVDQRPDAVVAPSGVDDVIAVMRFAADTGLRVAPQRTGHGASAMEDLSGTMLLKTGGMRGVEIDPVARRARISAGTLWQDLIPLAAEHGLAALHGSAPDIGIVGYTLGGGVGWLARRYGLACNSVLAIEVVTPDGELIRADRHQHPEMFWALRGGGGSFGVVTALEFTLYPVREVYAGVLFFPIERTREVLHAWRDWTEDVPDTVTSVGRVLRFPPLPDLPDPLRGGSFVVVEACMLESEPTAHRILRPLRELGAAIDTFEVSPLTRLSELHMDPPTPVPALAHHRLLGKVTPATIDAVVDTCGPRVDSPLLSVEVRHLGGAMATTRSEHGILDRLDATYAIFGVGMPMDPAHGEAIEEHLQRVNRAVAPWTIGRDYLNFAERPSTPTRIFGETAAARVADLVRRIDPHGRMVANHPANRR